MWEGYGSMRLEMNSRVYEDKHIFGGGRSLNVPTVDGR